VILGSTGSIGTNAIEVARHLEDVNVYGIAVNRDIEKLREQIEEFKPKVAVIADRVAWEKFTEIEKDLLKDTEVLCGEDGVDELSVRDDVDVIVNGISGLAGLKPTLAALSKGKKVASANKESIIMGWDLIKNAIQYEEQFLPVDSEHSAILQGLKGEDTREVLRIVLTASGGAVYKKSYNELMTVTANDCLSHPTWSMGHKITIDSATLMNKGLEVIEAHNLFAIDYSKIDVYIHPQSIIHGMVEYIDGTVIAHLAIADMKIPIQYALTHPARTKVPSTPLKIEDMCKLEFDRPDLERFPCLRVAIDAGKAGGLAPIVLCAADEVAVESFTKGMIGFMQIPAVIEEVLGKSISGTINTADDVVSIYNEAQKISQEVIKNLK
jgi:1-deoxy-D-xylulose-5-phosphate reductoisomerase